MKWFTRRRALILGIIVILAVIGFVWFRGRNAKLTYQLVSPTRKTLQDTLSASGKIDAAKKAVLKFPAIGKLGYLGVSEADEVKRGKLLANMDPGELQTAARAAYYKYLAADANAKQVEDEVKGHSADETFAQKNDRVAAQTARDIAYDNWLETNRNLSKAYLYAPFAGVVSSITVNAVGATVSVTDGVSVIDPSSLYFLTEVDETDLGKIQLGMKVKIKLDAFEDEIEGQISAIGFETTISSSGATVLPIRVTLPEAWLPRLKLGLNGDASILLRAVDNALVLPAEAVHGDEVILEDGTHKKIELGIITDEDIEIKSGLGESDKVRL